MSAISVVTCTSFSRSCLPLCSSVASSSKLRSKWSSMARLPRPVMTRMSVIPARAASSTTYWMAGLSTIGSISLGWLFVAGRNRVPSPAAGMTALRTLTFGTVGGDWSVNSLSRGGRNIERLGNADLVASGALGVVEGRVGGRDEFADRTSRLRVGGDAQRDGHIEVLAVVFEWRVGHSPADAFGERDRV